MERPRLIAFIAGFEMGAKASALEDSGFGTTEEFLSNLVNDAGVTRADLKRAEQEFADWLREANQKLVASLLGL